MLTVWPKVLSAGVEHELEAVRSAWRFEQQSCRRLREEPALLCLKGRSTRATKPNTLKNILTFRKIEVAILKIFRLW